MRDAASYRGARRNAWRDSDAPWQPWAGTGRWKPQYPKFVREHLINDGKVYPYNSAKRANG